VCLNILALCDAFFFSVIYIYTRIYPRTTAHTTAHTTNSIGFLLGISDEFNVCRETLAESLHFFNGVYKLGLQPYLLSPPLPAQFFAMATAYLEGCNLLLRLPFFSLKMFMYYVLVHGMGLVLPATHRVKMGVVDRCRVWMLRLFLWALRNVAPFRHAVNFCFLRMSRRAQILGVQAATSEMLPPPPTPLPKYLRSQLPGQLLNAELEVSPMYQGQHALCPFSMLAEVKK
jgi:hypothetical protein